ncbi:MAG: N-acetylmuramidase domain-containing protein [Dehalococcoidia bacterium]|nr:N-acetylmuramidase domain-containing protein [Dehalococcoidia bacterium]
MPDPTPRPTRPAVVLAAAAEFRRAPAQASSGTSLARGAAVEILRHEAGWYEVDSHVGRGWVSERALGVTSRELVADYLWQHEDLRAVPLDAPADRRLGAGVGALSAAVASAWNAYGGLLDALCRVVGVDPAAIAAVMHTESGGRGMGPDGRMIIRFENHLFRRYLGDERASLFDAHFRYDPATVWQGHQFCREGDAWQPCHQSQAGEWEVLEFARSLDETAALMSISMGVAQIMGFNHTLIGYDSVREMFDRFSTDIRFQILGMFDFIRGHGDSSPMLEALRVRNYEAFATGYNGNGQAAFYGGLISSAVAAFEQLQGSPAQPPAPGDATEDVYVVQPGDSLGRIAARFGTTAAALAAANGIANLDLIAPGQRLRIPGRPTVAEPPPPPPVADQTYTVQPGDILGRIAARFGVPLQAIIEANGIANPDSIQAGQVLRIPPATQPRELRPPAVRHREHLVLAGDTLRSVAAELGATPQALAAVNDLQLIPGQLLRAP